MSEPRWRRYLRFWRRDTRADVDDELRFHFDARVEQYMRAGMSRDEAMTAARAQFGDVDIVRGELVAIDRRIARRRDAHRWIDGMLSDVRFGVRSLRRVPGFSAAVIVTLALGLGANAAMFTLLDRVYLRPPSGVRDPGSVRRLWTLGFDRAGAPTAYSTLLSADEARDLEVAFGRDAQMALFGGRNVRLGKEWDAPTVSVTTAGAEYFSLLGARLSFGRLFTAAEAASFGQASVAIISHAVWRSRFSGDPGVLGKSVALGGVPVTIIGVMASDFSGIDLQRDDVWIPLNSALGLDVRGMRPRGSIPRDYGAILRVAPGVDEASLEARVTAVSRRTAIAFHNEDSLVTVKTASIIAARGPRKQSKEILIATRLAGVAAIVLLIACANVVNLLLARAVMRRREIAVRVALGASRLRLVRLLTADSLVLALVAGVAAVGTAYITGRLLETRLMPDIHFSSSPFHLRVVIATMAAALVAGAIAGSVPAALASRPRVMGFLKTGARDDVGGRSWLRSALVATQAAFAMILLVGAGLFVSSLRQVESIQLGYDVERIISATMLFDDWRSPDSTRFAAAGDRIRGIPGVNSVAYSTVAPLNGGMLSVRFYTATDSMHGDVRTGRDDVTTAMMVTSNFFRTTGMRIVRGRDFPADPVMSVIVNETMAHEYWPHEDALGQCVRFTKREAPCHTVIGVVADGHVLTVIEKPRAQIFAPLEHPVLQGMKGYNMIIRAEPRSGAAVVASARRVLLETFPGGRPRIDRLEDAIAPAYRPFRLGALLFSTFGLLALIVATVGVYSAVSYAVSQRTREFGVRVALGATLGDVVRTVLTGALTPVIVGMGIGIAAALAGGRLIASLLYGTSPTKMIVFVAVAVLLLAVATLAALVPASRASRVDPVIALRSE